MVKIMYTYLHEIKEGVHLIRDNHKAANYSAKRHDVSSFFVAKPWEKGTKVSVAMPDGSKQSLEAISSYANYLRKDKASAPY